MAQIDEPLRGRILSSHHQEEGERMSSPQPIGFVEGNLVGLGAREGLVLAVSRAKDVEERRAAGEAARAGLLDRPSSGSRF